MPASFVISGTSSYDAISGGPSFLCSLRSGDTSFFFWDGIRERMKRIYHGPAALSEISVGSWQIAAIDGDRRSIRWWIYGCNRHASHCQRFPESASGEYRSLTSGNDFTCAINGTHDVHCWGPHGNSIKRRFSGMYMHSLSAGGGSMCGLNKTGHIICTKNQPNVPSGESFEFTSLAVGSNQTCAITRKNGAVVCWGWDGGLYFPMGSTRFEFLVSGGNLTCGLTSDAFNVSCWGSNERNYSSASAVIQSLPNVLPGVCVSHQVSCPCGIYPNSWDRCGGGSGVICKKSDTSTVESCQQFSSQVIQHPLEIAPSHSNRKRLAEAGGGKGKKHDWVTALSRVGLVTSLALIFLPAIKTFYPFIRKREVDAKFSAYPYAMTLCNCLIYVLYAIAKSNTLILIINAIGALVEFAYALVVMRYGTLRQSVTIAVLYLGAALASIGLFMWLVLT